MNLWSSMLQNRRMATSLACFNTERFIENRSAKVISYALLRRLGAIKYQWQENNSASVVNLPLLLWTPLRHLVGHYDIKVLHWNGLDRYMNFYFIFLWFYWYHPDWSSCNCAVLGVLWISLPHIIIMINKWRKLNDELNIIPAWRIVLLLLEKLYYFLYSSDRWDWIESIFCYKTMIFGHTCLTVDNMNWSSRRGQVIFV